MATTHPRVSLRYWVRPDPEGWVLPEVPVPESRLHDLTLDHLKALLTAWIARSGEPLIVARNLAIRWLEDRPKVGVDPDLCLLVVPPEGDILKSLKLWRPGHHPPRLAIEVVSPSHPYKDYATAQDRYAACSVEELWVFDPLSAGPRTDGGPFGLQIWRRTPEGALDRSYAGEGPVASDVLPVWLAIGDGANGKELRLFDDAACTKPWRTLEQQERAEKERERAEKEAALAELAALKRQFENRHASDKP